MENHKQRISEFGFVRVCAASPKLIVGDPFYNVKEISSLLHQADKDEVQIMAFPELCISGYTCQDLFYQGLLQETCVAAFEWLLNETKGLSVLFVVGSPVKINDMLYNCAIVACAGEVIGIVPKTYLPNTKEFYEKRWFTTRNEQFAENVRIFGKILPFGKSIFRIEKLGITLGIEICEDLWSVIPPSSKMALEGASLIINLSASNELVSKARYRKELVAQQSARCVCGYVYASCGVFESTTDTVFSGDLLIAENGIIVGEGERFLRKNSYIIADLDFKRLTFERQINSNYSDSVSGNDGKSEFAVINVKSDINDTNFSRKLARTIAKLPFVPSDSDKRDENCEEIFNIQTASLAKRLEHTGIKKVFVGVSGGLDSTLALLVAHKTFKLLGLPFTDITGVTMPGFGTTDQTYRNAITLMEELGVTISEIDIRPSCMMHFEDIGHNPAQMDTTYENVQARERTQILMDLANKNNGLLIGTGDLSELALGWCTYNGDHMSMYGVNSSIPKTLIMYLIDWISKSQETEKVGQVLARVLDTPISPELLPPDANGDIAQKTQQIIGPYELHDFFLFCFLRKGDAPDKILFLAQKAFEGLYSHEEIRKWLKVFLNRFFSQQFKRSCMPDGPKVGSVSLSPRGDWKMPSDASVKAWIDSL